MVPRAKFEYAPFLIIQILDIRTIFTKDKKQRKYGFETENICLFLI